MAETIRQACARAQKAWLEADIERRRIFAEAIEQGVTYRALGRVVGISPSYLHTIVKAEGPSRNSEAILERPMP